jgi:hypothetical protein
LSAQASAFHQQFVQALTSGAGAYAAAEAANVNPLQVAAQDLLGAVNAPTEALCGRPLIGNGAARGTVNGVGQAGGAGGYLYGNGGAGGASTAAGRRRQRRAGASGSGGAGCALIGAAGATGAVGGPGALGADGLDGAPGT